MQRLVELWHVYKQSKLGVAGLIIVVGFAMVAILAPYIATHDPYLMSSEIFQPPSFSHLLGTNAVGQDVYSELIYGSRVSLAVGLIAASVVTALGALIGLVSGYFGGVADEVLMRVTDMVLVLPQLPLMIVLAAYLGPGLPTIVFVIVIIGWASLARQVRSQVLTVREYTFVEAAKALGASPTGIIVGHILPNITGILIANFIMGTVGAILFEAGLSFLGLGDPLHKSWGVMLYFAQVQGAFSMGAWWWIFPPGLCIALLGCSFIFIGTTINDRFGLRLGRAR